jgi:transcription elongation factor Elf1
MSEHPLELEFTCLICQRTLRKPLTINPAIVSCKFCGKSQMVYRTVRADVAPPDESAASG